ncbi:MAG: hypothetical protein H6592_01670 [Flavobacteriales bacterium]|nr:hypothetical protein [Flavobacteriales bacterium]HPF91741.1 hypothetical protein [Flavobacteriales bacterium]
MEIAHDIIADLQQRRTRLVAEAKADPIQGMVVLTYDHGPYGVQAYYEKDTDTFVEIDFFLNGVPDEEVKVNHSIHPPRGKGW